MNEMKNGMILAIGIVLLWKFLHITMNMKIAAEALAMGKAFTTTTSLNQFTEGMPPSIRALAT
jgi:hypothetical protein